MKRNPEELAALLARFEAKLRASGLKRTPQRLEAFRIIAGTGDHPDIESVYRDVRKTIPAVSLDTIYRTLGLFRELGLVTTVRPRPERVRFDANTAPHHHFVCQDCGSIRDFEDRVLDDWAIPAAAKALGSVLSARIEVRGTCPDCAGTKKAVNIKPKRRERHAR